MDPNDNTEDAPRALLLYESSLLDPWLGAQTIHTFRYPPPRHAVSSHLDPSDPFIRFRSHNIAMSQVAPPASALDENLPGQKRPISNTLMDSTPSLHPLLSSTPSHSESITAQHSQIGSRRHARRPWWRYFVCCLLIYLFLLHHIFRSPSSSSCFLPHPFSSYVSYLLSIFLSSCLPKCAALRCAPTP
ncbi:hypothetical protein HDK64DRAFT_90505 [Phyllosticta capitalensis]